MFKLWLLPTLVGATMLTSLPNVQAKDTSNLVFVGGTVIMRVRVGAGGYSPEQRAEQIQQRVNKVLGQGPISPTDITVQNHGNEASVLVKGQLLFTADDATARFNKTTPNALATQWADKMRAVLPGLTEAK